MTPKSLKHFLQPWTLSHRTSLRQEQTVQLTSHKDKTSLLRMTNHLCVCGTVCPPLPGGSGPTVDPIVHRDPWGWGGPARVSVSNARLIHTGLLINAALCCPLTKGQECLCDAPATKQGNVQSLSNLCKRSRVYRCLRRLQCDKSSQYEVDCVNVHVVGQNNERKRHRAVIINSRMWLHLSHSLKCSQRTHAHLQMLTAVG